MIEDSQAPPAQQQVSNDHHRGEPEFSTSSFLFSTCSSEDIGGRRNDEDDRNSSCRSDTMILDACFPEEEEGLSTTTGNGSCYNPKQHRRAVRFSSWPPETIPSFSFYTRERESIVENTTTWYTVQELTQFRNEARQLCRTIRLNKQQRYAQQLKQQQQQTQHHNPCESTTATDDDNDEAELRGLELRASWTRQSMKHQLICFVLTQQRCLSAERLADSSIQASRRAVSLARQEAARDFFRAYYSELDPAESVQRFLVDPHRQNRNRKRRKQQQQRQQQRQQQLLKQQLLQQDRGFVSPSMELVTQEEEEMSEDVRRTIESCVGI